MEAGVERVFTREDYLHLLNEDLRLRKAAGEYARMPYFTAGEVDRWCRRGKLPQAAYNEGEVVGPAWGLRWEERTAEGRRWSPARARDAGRIHRLYLRGKGSGEIASLTGCSESTVKRRLGGRKRLRRAFNQAAIAHYRLEEKAPIEDLAEAYGYTERRVYQIVKAAKKG